MSNTVVNSIDLTGYLTYGRFNVNDYEFELGRGTDTAGKTGMVLTVKDGEGNVLSSEMCYDGEPGMTQAQIDQVTALFNSMQAANPIWTDAEEARRIAEWGADGNGTGTGNRQGLYALMLDLYNRYIDGGIDAMQTARDETVTAAQQAAASAQAAASSAESAALTLLGGWAKPLFYFDGDVVKFVSADGDDGDNDIDFLSSLTESASLNANGYITNGCTEIHIKIPVAKSLMYINGITCNSFVASIHNDGGYGLTGGWVYMGSDYAPYIVGLGIDKVQNCIHICMRTPGRFALTNNQPISVRSGNIQFTLSGSTMSDVFNTDSEDDESSTNG